jgi:hypothetical protein
MDSELEVPLSGGRVTPGVVRIGDTVRRPPRLNAEFVQGLLEHLTAVGFDWAPRFLGVDEKGNRVDVAADSRPATVARPLRLVKDVPAGAVAAKMLRQKWKIETIAHHASTIFRPMMPARISARNVSRRTDTFSPSAIMPAIATPSTPMPTHTA